MTLCPEVRPLGRAREVLRNPLRKPERAKARTESAPSLEKVVLEEVETVAAETVAVSGLASPGNGDQSPTKKSPSRPAIPAAAAAEHELGSGVMERSSIKRAACG